ncbi:MAG TPA: type II toxin-antitoxin system HicA family toxin [archaeon]|nr:type II toxin-antitoxin system HicA family toxin [archaeon]
MKCYGKAPNTVGGKIQKALSLMGFLPLRQRGSHVFMRHPNGRSTVVPMHKGPR